MDNLLPRLTAVVRCYAHSAQGSLEACLDVDPEAKALIQDLVTRFASDSDRGGLGRALKNSPKLARLFEREIQTDLCKIEELCTSTNSCMKANFAAQRFNSIVDVLRLLSLRINSVVKFLIRVAGTDDDKKLRTWAKSILKVTGTGQVIVF